MREYTLTEKQQLLQDWGQGDEWTRWGLEWMHNLAKFKRTRWKRTLEQITALPAEQQPAMHMRRVNGQRLSQRARTTTKDISSAKVLKLALSWQAQFWKKKCPVRGEWCHAATLWNMDETSVYLDMPPSKTLELVGAKAVEIATTQHEYTRVAVTVL